MKELRARADVRYVSPPPGTGAPPRGPVGPAQGEVADAEEVGEGGAPPAEADAGGGVVPPHDRHLGDAQAPSSRHVESLDVEGEAVEAAGAEGRLRGRRGEELEPALGVGEAGQQQRLDEHVEEPPHGLPVGGLVHLDPRPRDRARADRDVDAAIDLRLEPGQLLDRRREVGVGHQPPLARRGQHPAAHRVALPAVGLVAQDAHEVPRRAGDVRGGVGRAVVDDDDLVGDARARRGARAPGRGWRGAGAPRCRRG